jgi:hypothetical protein
MAPGMVQTKPAIIGGSRPPFSLRTPRRADLTCEARLITIFGIDGTKLVRYYGLTAPVAMLKKLVDNVFPDTPLD